MKKTYISPTLKVKQIVLEQIMQTSITNIGGNSGLEKGTGETPTEADAKSYGNYNVWDDEF